MSLRIFLFGFLMLVCALLAHPAKALIGGKAASDDPRADHVVMIVSTRGSICGGAVLSPTRILTAGHCMYLKAEYAVAVRRGGTAELYKVKKVKFHPRFDARGFKDRIVSIDLAELTLEEPLPPTFRPVTLDTFGRDIAPDEPFTVFGFGVTKEGDEEGVGVLRSLELQATAPFSKIQLRMRDPLLAGYGSCKGDSGSPIFKGNLLVGVVSWASGKKDGAFCGDLTGGARLQRDFVTVD